MEAINQFLITLDGFLGSSSWFVYLLLGVGLFFTIYLKFPQIRFFGHALKIVRGKFDRKDDEGDTSHFQALATALSGTVGTGNIAGVAFAIHLGGPAALFWMLVTAFVGMCTKFVEVTLSHKYREKAQDGSMSGGPMYFMKNATFKIGSKKVNLTWLAALFAVATVVSSFGTGNMPQINSIASVMKSTFDISEYLTGGVLALFLGLVIVGGIKRIAGVTEKLVPTMAILYFISALAVIFYNAGNIVPAIGAIIGDVFSGSAATGGFIGATIAYAFNRGVNRGLFSNEAGQGSAPIAHASAKANEPVSEGMVAILEPFIDTIIICTLTGLAILSSGVWNEKHQNEFAYNDLVVLEGVYTEASDDHKLHVFNVLDERGKDDLYQNTIQVENGAIINTGFTVIHARSFAKEVVVSTIDGNNDKVPYSGSLQVENGAVKQPKDVSIIFDGKSLVHSAPLTSIAFTRSFFGDFGKFVVALGLLLFAFSTAISWSYYGDRAMTYLFGSKSVLIFRIVYIAGFFAAAVIDTTIVWSFSAVAIALMTVPNLVGILWLRGDMKRTVKKYWVDFEKEHGQRK